MPKIVLINDGVRREIQRVISYAREHPLTLATLKKIKRGQLSPAGDSPGYRCIIPGSHLHKVVFTVDQTKNGKWVKHISISQVHNKLPSIPAAGLILNEFKFINPLEKCFVMPEDDPDVNAVNIYEPLYDETEPWKKDE